MTSPLLLSPFTLRDLTLKNRLVISPMCQYSAIDGVVTDWHLVHLGRFALGGAALVIVEATGVEARGRISPGDVGLWNDDQARALARIADFLKASGAAAGFPSSVIVSPTGAPSISLMPAMTNPTSPVSSESRVTGFGVKRPSLSI